VKRREFIALVGSATAATAWPLAARAQEQPKLPTIGVLGPTTASIAVQWTSALAQRLGELGWIDGHTVAIEYRWAQGRTERAAEIASEFVRLKVDVIVTSGTRNVIAAKQATSTIPIVFVSAGDPVGYGLVASLARPGGNVTGLSSQSTDLTAKRIELLREATPRLSRMAVMVNPSNPNRTLEMVEVQAAANTLGIEVVTLEVQRTEDIAPAIDAVKNRVQALIVMGDRLTFDSHILINTLALAARLPTMHGFRANVESGGLMSYGPNFRDLSRRAADYVDKILRGTKPVDLAVQQPTKFELLINLKTAKALGLDMPPRLLMLADELIE
jgi:putative ABC transport system substrate-binding protein